MDDKIINQLDSIDEADTDQLLNSIGIYEEVGTGTANRIKTSVLKKAGINRKFKSPLIPNKIIFFAGCFALSLIELLFFSVSAFIAWMDGFLSGSGIDLSFGGIVPVILYVIMFSFMSLSLYLVMYQMDSRLSLKRVIPKNRTFLTYFLYFILSAALKVLLLISLMYLAEHLPYDYFDFFGFLISSIIVFPTVDMLLSKLKNWVIMRYEGFSSSPYNWRIDMRSFLLELLKYTVIAGAVIILGFLYSASQESEITGVMPSLTGVFILWFINMFFSIVVLLKKRHYLLTIRINKNVGYKETAGEAQQLKPGKRWLYFRQRAVVMGVLGAVSVYVLCLFIPYFGGTAFKPERPSLIPFSSKDAAMCYFKDGKLPFNRYSYSRDVNDFIESLYGFNKMLTGIACFIPSSPFEGALNMERGSSDLATTASFAGSSMNRLTATFSDGFSKTNTQVGNVDEADVIKTDGEYMYYLSHEKLSIVKANPPENMEVIHQHDFGGEGLTPRELFLYKGHLAVILTGEINSNKTIVRTYNVEDPYNLKQEREFKLEYSYLTARMVENNLYLVSTTSSDYGSQWPPSPFYFDSAKGSQALEIDYRNLYFMHGSTSSSYTSMNVVASFPVDKPRGKAQVKGYIGGSGENVYVSTRHIYIVESSHNVPINAPVKDFIDNFTSTDSYSMDLRKYGTDIYRIDIQDGTIGGFNSAFVSGTVHNQFSMDEYDGYFRLATQTGNFDNASSNVYVLDQNMKLCGSLEGLAPKESIYSSRFIGDRLYLVTFKKVDPLFVISLKDPQNPTVLGKLKIPGYSEYIHPLDENHIIGFGKDTAGGDESFSWYQGIKMAIFDVTDVKNPKEKFVENIGDRGTDSELLRNHKALMYMKERGLMAFPVSVAKVPEGSKDYEYGNISFQGAYVYNVSSNGGFKLRGKITHMDQKSQYSFPNMVDETNDDFVSRIIYANESLYTFSGGKVKATRYSDMQNVSEISLERTH